MTDYTTVISEEIEQQISDISDKVDALLETAVNSEEYNLIYSNLFTTIEGFMTLHRNWNSKNGSINEEEDEYDVLPVDWSAPKVDYDDFSSVEFLATDLWIAIKSLESPRGFDWFRFNQLSSAVSDLRTYHSRYNERNGEIDPVA